MTSDILEDIKKEILDKLPAEIQVSKVEFEGPEVVVYTKNPEIITENGDLIRSLAKELRKRLIIRSDKCALLEPEQTINKIHEIVPEGAEITDIYFDTVTGEVVITAKKPGLVIGKYGVTSRNIVKNTGWAPKILRTPPISSDIIGKIRTIQKNSSKERKKCYNVLDVKSTKELSTLMIGQESLPWEDLKKLDVPQCYCKPLTVVSYWTAELMLQHQIIKLHSHT